MEGGFRKYHVPHKEKTSRKAYTERDDKSSDMRFENEKAQVQVLFVQNEVVAYEKNENIEKSIGAAA